MAKLVPQAHGGAINQREKGDPASPDVGRPKSSLRRLLDEWDKQGKGRASKTDIDLAYTRAMDMSEDEMKVTANDKTAPMLLRIVCRELLKNRGFDTMEKMIDRAYGKSTQPIQGDVSITLVNYADKQDEDSI